MLKSKGRLSPGSFESCRVICVAVNRHGYFHLLYLRRECPVNLRYYISILLSKDISIAGTYLVSVISLLQNFCRG